MTYRKQTKRSRNWRASRSNQLFCMERNFRLLEKRFWYYNKIKLAVNNEKAERDIYLSASGANGSYNSGLISNPTLDKVIRDTEAIDCVLINADTMDEDTVWNPEKWVFVVETTLDYYKENDPMVWDILTRRYMLNEGSPNTCIDLDISPNKYYKARDAGLQYARECAIQLNLIHAFDPEKVTSNDKLRVIQSPNVKEKL